MPVIVEQGQIAQPTLHKYWGLRATATTSVAGSAITIAAALAQLCRCLLFAQHAGGLEMLSSFDFSQDSRLLHFSFEPVQQAVETLTRSGVYMGQILELLSNSHQVGWIHPQL
jgi:hypothetical protein